MLACFLCDPNEFGYEENMLRPRRLFYNTKRYLVLVSFKICFGPSSCLMLIGVDELYRLMTEVKKIIAR